MMKKLILAASLLAMNASATDFAFKLYDQLSKTDGNLFFSPASIEAALAMTAEGARGNTQQQFFQTLETSGRQECLPHDHFPMVGKHVVLENANAIWVDQQFPILGTFKTAVSEKHQAEIRAVDFRSQANTERLKINDWVEKKTRDKIQDLLPDGSVNAMTRMILVNAIYFKGDWLHAFDPIHTEPAPFQTLENGAVEVPMMRLNRTRFAYGENDCFQTLELPYEGAEVSMLIFLPRNKTKQIDLKAMLSTVKEQPLRKTDVNVFLPRFKVESTFASLKRNLAALGLTDAFNAQEADFSGISAEPLFISDVVHKAFVEVNEKGTEAAAATGIIIRTTSIPAPPVTFRADHPFIFMIRENESGKILFMGRVVNPLD